MGKSAGKAPDPVDPNVTADAQTRSNIATADYAQKLGMVNSTGPTGSVSYQSDPNAPGGYRQVTDLSPEQQRIYSGTSNAQGGALDLANMQLRQIGQTLQNPLQRQTLNTSFGPTDFTADRNAVTDAVYGQARSRLDPMFQQQEDSERNRLSNQGLSQNSTAYRTAMNNFGRNKNDAYNQALYSAIGQGANEQNQLFGQRASQAQFGNTAMQDQQALDINRQQQPLNQFSALLGAGNGSGIVLPQSARSNATVGQTDVMGAYGLQQQGANNAYNAKVSQANATNQGVANLAGAALGSGAVNSGLGWLGGLLLSDRRYKKNISLLGERPDGLGLYMFHYHNEPDFGPLHVGVMADEVRQVYPDAVHRIDGADHVDYGML